MQPDRVIVGSGKLALALLKQLTKDQSGKIYLVARNSESANRLLNQFPGLVRINYSEIPEHSICFLAVSDYAIEACAQEIVAKECVLIHFSGSTSIQVLHGNSAVLWPIHSFGNPTENWGEIPLAAEVSSDSVKPIIESVASVLGSNLVFISAQQREKMHMLAVFANNFSNHLFKLAYDYCLRNNLDFNLLIHLIVSGTRALETNSPDQLQTGPAVRNDEATIAKHMELLKHETEMQYLYRLFSDSIKKNA